MWTVPFQKVLLNTPDCTNVILRKQFLVPIFSAYEVFNCLKVQVAHIHQETSWNLQKVLSWYSPENVYISYFGAVKPERRSYYITQRAQSQKKHSSEKRRKNRCNRLIFRILLCFSRKFFLCDGNFLSNVNFIGVNFKSFRKLRCKVVFFLFCFCFLY